jgi:hypothetical protein
MIIVPNTTALWRFENNANDSSGNGRSLSVDGATLTTDARRGRAYSFDGTNDMLNINSSAFNIGDTGKFTAAFWFKSSATNTFAVFSKSTGEVGAAGTRGYWLNFSDTADRINFRVNYGDGSGGAGTNFTVWGSNTGVFSSLLNGQWHHMAVRINARSNPAVIGDVSIFVDGVPITTGNFATTGTSFWHVTLDNAQDFRLGIRGRGDAGTSYIVPYAGILDEFVYFSRALSSFDIRRLMLGLHPMQTPTSIPPEELP